MSDSDSSVKSMSVEPFGSDSGSEYLPKSNRQKRKRYGLSNKIISETNATTSASVNSENDKTLTSETVAVCDSGSKRKKQQHLPMQDSGSSSTRGDTGTTGRKKFCDFFEIEVDTSTNSKNKNDKLAKCIPCFQKHNKSVFLKMKNSGTSGLKRHLKAKHGMLFDKEFSQGVPDRSKFQCSASSESGRSNSILDWMNRSQSKENVS